MSHIDDAKKELRRDGETHIVATWKMARSLSSFIHPTIKLSQLRSMVQFEADSNVTWPMPQDAAESTLARHDLLKHQEPCIMRGNHRRVRGDPSTILGRRTRTFHEINGWASLTELRYPLTPTEPRLSRGHVTQIRIARTDALDKPLCIIAVGTDDKSLATAHQPHLHYFSQAPPT